MMIVVVVEAEVASVVVVAEAEMVHPEVDSVGEEMMMVAALAAAVDEVASEIVGDLVTEVVAEVVIEEGMAVEAAVDTEIVEDSVEEEVVTGEDIVTVVDEVAVQLLGKKTRYFITKSQFWLHNSFLLVTVDVTDQGHIKLFALKKHHNFFTVSICVSTFVLVSCDSWLETRESFHFLL